MMGIHTSTYTYIYIYRYIWVKGWILLPGFCAAWAIFKVLVELLWLTEEKMRTWLKEDLCEMCFLKNSEFGSTWWKLYNKTVSIPDFWSKYRYLLTACYLQSSEFRVQRRVSLVFGSGQPVRVQWCLIASFCSVTPFFQQPVRILLKSHVDVHLTIGLTQFDSIQPWVKAWRQVDINQVIQSNPY